MLSDGMWFAGLADGMHLPPFLNPTSSVHILRARSDHNEGRGSEKKKKSKDGATTIEVKNATREADLDARVKKKSDRFPSPSYFPWSPSPFCYPPSNSNFHLSPSQGHAVDEGAVHPPHRAAPHDHPHALKGVVCVPLKWPYIPLS